MDLLQRLKMTFQILLLLLICASQVDLRPATALDQPAGELEWEAWLLIHGNARPGKTSDGEPTTLKRITPKSIFTVRPFALPPCAEGYRSDPMGRCVKLIKVDQNLHLGFLVEKLNNMYDEEDYADVEEEEEVQVQPTPGPLQFNIPFGDAPDSGEPEESSKQANNTLSLIPLPRDMVKNITGEVPSNNGTLISFLDDLMSDEPKDEYNKTNVTKHSDDSETIIILFHPLASNTTESPTTEDPTTIPTTTEDLTTTEEIPTTTTTEPPLRKTAFQSLMNTNSNYEDSERLEEAEFRPNYLTSVLTPHYQSGDYKTSFFSRRWRNNTRTTPKNTIEEKPIIKPTVFKEVFNTTQSDLDTILTKLIKLNTTRINATKKNIHMNVTESTTARLEEYRSNHRNRDRHLFWSSPVYAPGVPTTSARINSRYSNLPTTETVLHRPYGAARKSLYSDTLFNRRRWSNR